MGSTKRSVLWFVVQGLVVMWLAQVSPAVGQEGFSESPIFLRNLNDTRDGIGPCSLTNPRYFDNCTDPDGDGPLELGDGHQWTWNQKGPAFDSQGNYYIVDQFPGKVKKFDRWDRMVTEWSISGQYWNDAWDVDVDSDDNVWVSTRRDGVVRKYDGDGHPLPGSIYVQARISGIHIDSQDRIFVGLDGPADGAVRRYDNGVFVLQVYPINNPIDMVTDSEGNIWVSVSDLFFPGYFLRKYSPNGALLKRFFTDGFPYGMAFDSHDRLYISHLKDDHRVRVHDTDLNELYSFGSAGTGEGEFMIPAQLAFTPSGHTLYINDRNNARFSVFGSPEGGIESLINEIEGLIEDGALNGGQGNALIVKLEAALHKLLDDKTKTAINQLGAFRNQVEAFMQSGELPLEEGQPLLDAVDTIIEAMGG